MAVLALDPLPADPLAAAALFHARDLPRITQALPAAGALVLQLAPAGHDHRAWRLAAVQGLARAHAPLRINAVEGMGAPAEALARWLEAAEAVTGQILACDGEAAGTVLG